MWLKPGPLTVMGWLDRLRYSDTVQTPGGVPAVLGVERALAPSSDTFQRQY
ncbi:MAG: hypothetical protein R2857_05375 [Vampirovibrionales bacterium]